MLWFCELKPKLQYYCQLAKNLDCYILSCLHNF